MKLYDYYRSTASCRVRIALNLKEISYEAVAINLINDGGEQHHTNYLDINPQGLVPTLNDHDQSLSQSLAIIEYLDEKYPTPALLPKDPWSRGQVRSLAMMIACDIHPLNNLRVLQQLRLQFDARDKQINEWYHHWLQLGFDAIETKLQTIPRQFNVCFGDTFSLADVCLIPQIYNAQRFNFSMRDYPIICQINDFCLSTTAFSNAMPKA